MKNSPSTSILIGVLTLCVLASVVLCWFYIHNAGELRSLQVNVAAINNRRGAINALANDANEYGQKHPDIYQAVGLNAPKSAAATTNKPSK